MENANGSSKAPKASKATTNGINGAIKSPLNGHAVGHTARPTRKPRPDGPGLLARTFSIAAR